MSASDNHPPLTPTVPKDVCPDCGRAPITWAEVAIIVGYTAVVVVLWEIGQAVYRAVWG